MPDHANTQPRPIARRPTESGATRRHANLYDALYRLENAVWEAQLSLRPMATACRASDIPAMLKSLGRGV